MAEPQAVALVFSVLLILIGLPLSLFGLLQFLTQPSTGFTILAISISMLFLGAVFIIIMLTQK